MTMMKAKLLPLLYSIAVTATALTLSAEATTINLGSQGETGFIGTCESLDLPAELLFDQLGDSAKDIVSPAAVWDESAMAFAGRSLSSTNANRTASSQSGIAFPCRHTPVRQILSNNPS